MSSFTTDGLLRHIKCFHDVLHGLNYADYTDEMYVSSREEIERFLNHSGRQVRFVKEMNRFVDSPAGFGEAVRIFIAQNGKK